MLSVLPMSACGPCEPELTSAAMTPTHAVKSLRRQVASGHALDAVDLMPLWWSEYRKPARVLASLRDCGSSVGQAPSRRCARCAVWVDAQGRARTRRRALVWEA
eukprot:6207901-Pleurochrysis_carterae.AAC.1